MPLFLCSFGATEIGLVSALTAGSGSAPFVSLKTAAFVVFDVQL